jgi:hypothetical protein
MALVKMWLERYIRDWATDSSVPIWAATYGRLKEFSFWELLESRSTARCSDSRDWIYSLLAMPAAHGPMTALKADYDTDPVHLFLKATDLLRVWNMVERAGLLLHTLDLNSMPVTWEPTKYRYHLSQPSIEAIRVLSNIWRR